MSIYNSFYKYILYFFIGFISFSCSKTSQPSSNQSIGFTPKTIEDENTKVSVNDDVINSGAFKIYGIIWPNNLSKHQLLFNNETITYNSALGGWSYAPVRYWDRNNVPYYFMAYWPASLDGVYTEVDAGNINTKIFAIKDFSTLKADGSVKKDEVLFYSKAFTCTATQPSTSGVLNIEFRHILSCISFKLVKSNLFSSTTSVKLLEYSLLGMRTQGTFTCTDDVSAWEATGTEYTGTAYGKKGLSVPISNDGNLFITEELMIPQLLLTNVYLKVKYSLTESGNSTKTYEKTLYISRSTSKWEMGKKYVYSLIVAPNYIYFDKPTVTPWGNATQAGGIIIK